MSDGTDAPGVRDGRCRISQDITLFTSAALIAELEDVLSREKFAKRITEVGSSVAEMVGDYLALAHRVLPTVHPSIVRDPDDDHVLAAALAAQAHIIVSPAAEPDDRAARAHAAGS